MTGNAENSREFWPALKIAETMNSHLFWWQKRVTASNKAQQITQTRAKETLQLPAGYKIIERDIELFEKNWGVLDLRKG